ncbi:phage tail tube protein [Paracoccus sp. SY]|uniref:phage tail tube protein n=1 Tax=Paracoccus sp. SY TaxID=1330255 RepID=UPI000CD1D84A|nr:phage tail tube protein [Paracoccus sp. SY]
MADNLTTGIGTILYVSATIPATLDEAGFAAITGSGWVEVGEITEIPDYGGTSEVVTHTPLKTGVQEKFHGAENAGSLQIPMAYDPSDAGQAILKAAKADKKQRAFRVEYPKVDVAATAGRTDYFVGKVFGVTRGATTGGVVSGTVTVELDMEPIEVAED